jgi:type II secretory pathway pseudopilin PulG
MLEEWYWVAGIVMAVVAVVGLFVRSKSKSSVDNRQNATVSGQNNTVNQASETRTGEHKEHQ